MRSPLSRHIIPKVKQKVNRLLMRVTERPRYKERSEYHEGHQSTPGNAPNVYENLVKYVCLATAWLNSTALSEDLLLAAALLEAVSRLR